MRTAALILLLSATNTMNSADFAKKLQAFAKDGGGEIYAVAVTLDPKQPGYTFSHWSGLFTTAALRDAQVKRPSPAYLLICNHPSSRESDNQNVVEELVRWDPDGTFVSTGIVYSKWGGKGRSSEEFKAAATKLLKRP